MNRELSLDHCDTEENLKHDDSQGSSAATGASLILSSHSVRSLIFNLIFHLLRRTIIQFLLFSEQKFRVITSPSVSPPLPSMLEVLQVVLSLYLVASR